MIPLYEVKLSMVLEIRILVTTGSIVDWEEAERSLLGSGNILYLDNNDSYTDMYISKNTQTLHLKLVHYTHFVG